MSNTDSNEGYTPYGYLQNPYHQCTNSFRDITGPLLRTDDVFPGFGCFFPDIKHCNRQIAMGIGALWKGQRLFSRSDWEKFGYDSNHHSLNLFSFRLPFGEDFMDVLYSQGTQYTLNAKIVIPQSLQNQKDLTLFWIVHLKACNPFSVKALKYLEDPFVSGMFLSKEKPICTSFKVTLDGVDRYEQVFSSNNIANILSEERPFDTPIPDELFISKPFRPVQNTLSGDILFYDFQPTPDKKTNKKSNHWTLGHLDKSLGRKEAEDRIFRQKMPCLSGDWPQSVKNGWVYDFETTRMCCYPPMGVFQDIWPSWMLAAPRAVLAEGAMDMNRLGYADPNTAKRAILTLFRDTGAENVPCVFFTGVPNMVAEDGSVCGTSPAWCLPFFQIFQLYLREPDKNWLKALYPYMKAYHMWWRENRSDESGYAVYRCTWEAGEDDSPRLDPKRTGNGIISDYVRPVELQASMAINAHIMKFFSQELSLPDDIDYWEEQKTGYAKKLQSLWDPAKKRFRDWDKDKNTWLQVTGKNDYWQADFTRLSPLSLASVLFDLCTESQKEAMKSEILLYAREPFNVWPSWTYVLSEAAAALKMNRFLSDFAWEIIERVYGENDSRVLTTGKPLPGSTREYWPLEKDTFMGNDAYAWGAQTATLLIRHIMGFRSSLKTNESALTLCPNIPDPLMIEGTRYGIENIPYRGIRLDIHYEINIQKKVQATIKTKDSYKLIVQESHQDFFKSNSSTTHEVTLENGGTYYYKLIHP